MRHPVVFANGDRQLCRSPHGVCGASPHRVLRGSDQSSLSPFALRQARKRCQSAIFGAALAVVAMALAGTPAWGHHAFSAEFDANKEVNLRGTVAKMDWINPHAWIHIDVKQDDGTTERWMVELGPPNSLIKRGWTKNSLPSGTELVVVGYQAKDGAMRANGRHVTFPDGRKLFAGSSGTGAPDDGAEK